MKNLKKISTKALSEKYINLKRSIAMEVSRSTMDMIDELLLLEAEWEKREAIKNTLAK